ncbi:MAG TPA: HAD-IIB family hydrolase [Candidatus Paceibacterota bacterium]|nr:HAD-IIB family hydrolase [Candidatus Paceibacterota bacterium]
METPNLPPLVIFDLDGTLAESKQPLSAEMAVAFAQLLSVTRAGIISGGALSQFLSQVVGTLPADASLPNLSLLPTSGGALYEYGNGAWRAVYAHEIPEADVARIESAMRAAAEETGIIDLASPAHGERIEFRGAQVSFSALGQHAPPDEKRLWDPSKEKRRRLADAMQKLLPAGYVASFGGSTTIDVVADGIDKAYGITQLAQHLGIPERDALFVGDELAEGGNDFPATRTEARCQPVANPSETLALIRALTA